MENEINMTQTTEGEVSFPSDITLLIPTELKLSLLPREVTMIERRTAGSRVGYMRFIGVACYVGLTFNVWREMYAQCEMVACDASDVVIDVEYRFVDYVPAENTQTLTIYGHESKPAA